MCDWQCDGEATAKFGRYYIQVARSPCISLADQLGFTVFYRFPWISHHSESRDEKQRMQLFNGVTQELLRQQERYGFIGSEYMAKPFAMRNPTFWLSEDVGTLAGSFFVPGQAAAHVIETLVMLDVL